MRIVSSVHFGQQFQNAYWDPARRQMVFGDGGDFLWNFPAALDVIGHELTHAVTENTSPLFYHGQSGALNEHVSDVFGIMAKQIKDNTEANEADWLIGEDCLMPGTKGVALRSMKDPGTAYDDPRFVSTLSGADGQRNSFANHCLFHGCASKTDTYARAKIPSRRTSATLTLLTPLTMAECTNTPVSPTGLFTSSPQLSVDSPMRKRDVYGGTP